MNIIITSGGTSENIDNVRKITNSATGMLGSIIANEFIKKHDKNIKKLYYLCPKTAILPNLNKKIKIVEITNTESLKNKIEELLQKNKIDVFVHAMAVSDYTPISIQDQNGNIITNSKISSSLSEITIKLKPTPKIISIIKKISPKTKLVGFKLLSNVKKQELVNVAYNLLQKNDCDFVLANDTKNITTKKHIGYLVNKDKQITKCNTKQQIAEEIVKNLIKELKYEIWI